MKHALFAATLVLVAGTAVGCGSSGSSGGSSSTSASQSDFCNTYTEIAKDSSTDVKAAKDDASKLAKVGTPAGIPDDARKGFELTIDKINSLSDSASEADAEKLFTSLSATETAEVTAFGTYVIKECPDAVPSAAATTVPTDPAS